MPLQPPTPAKKRSRRKSYPETEEYRTLKNPYSQPAHQIPSQKMLAPGNDDRKEELSRLWAKTEIREAMCPNKKNYKVYTNIHLSPTPSTRFLSVLDTGAGANFMHENVLRPELLKQVKTEDIPLIRETNKHRLMMGRTIRIRVPLGSLAPEVKFMVCENLAVSVVWRGEFCERFVEAIYPPRKYVVLDDSSTIPIIRETQDGAPKDEEVTENTPKFEGSVSPLVKMWRGKKIPAGRQV